MKSHHCNIHRPSSIVHRLLFTIFSLLLTACSIPSLPVALAPTATLAPTAVPPTATQTATATSTPTVTLTPTATQTATATSTPTVTPTPAPTDIPLTPTPTFVPLTADERIQLFEQIWAHVRDSYVYTDYHGLDWDAIHAEYLPRVTDAPDMEAFYGLMREMIDRLGDDHSRYETPQDVEEERARFAGDLNYVGIGAIVRDIPEGGLITRLARGGPAEEAGLRVRDTILTIEGIAFTDTASFGPRGPIGMMRGQPGTTVQLTVQSPGEQPRDIAVIRRVIPTEAFPSVEAQRLPGTQIGYVLIDTFSLAGLDDRVSEELRKLTAEGPLDGLILDVRSNSGGQVGLMLNTIGLFVDGGSIGRGQGRQRAYDLNVPDGRAIAELSETPIAVLSGEDSISAGEIFASGMQTLGRAQIVGLPSAGNTENLIAEDFSDGSRLWLAELIFYRPDGTTIEGAGVQPDVRVDAEWWRYDLINDPQVQAAVDLIEKG